jgi:DNA-binding MarR family transcriptional regulator
VTPRSGLSVLFDLFVVDSAARTLLAPVMGPTGLTANQYAEYSIVAVEGPLSVTRFAEVARLPLTTASDTLRAMERRGHVSRFRDPRDGRSRLVDLTPEGREAHSRARRAFRTAAGRVSRHLGDREPDVRAALTLLAEACAAAHDDGPRPERSEAVARSVSG